MAEHRLDFHSTFRRLAYFRLSMAETSQGTESNKELDEYIQSVLTLTPEPQMVDQMKASTDLKAWLERYVARIKSEREQWGDDIDAEREKASRAVNPRFVLRQWVLEEVIKKVEQDADSGKRVLRKVLQVCIHTCVFHRRDILSKRSCRWLAIRSIHGVQKMILAPKSHWMVR